MWIYPKCNKHSNAGEILRERRIKKGAVCLDYLALDIRIEKRDSLKMKLHIKNMVSIRCTTIVKQELYKLGLHFIIVELGEWKLWKIFQPSNASK